MCTCPRGQNTRAPCTEQTKSLRQCAAPGPDRARSHQRTDVGGESCSNALKYPSNNGLGLPLQGPSTTNGNVSVKRLVLWGCPYDIFRCVVMFPFNCDSAGFMVMPV